MGVSFKVARVGWRYTPRSIRIDEDSETENGNGNGNDHQEQVKVNEGRLDLVEDQVASHSNKLAEPALHQALEDLGASFSINLFLHGFSFGKPSEVFNDVPKQLIPYDRASEAFFTAIEYGWLPGDIFNQISCKYVNGAVLCEIQDYRNCLSQKAGADSAETSPTIHKVLLHMSMENVVKDVLSISNESWSYEDLLKVESRILKALQPDLCLNPDPLLDHEVSLTKKINLGITWGWRKRKLSCVQNFNSQNSAQESNFRPSVAYHGTEVPTSHKDISIAVLSKVAQENIHNCQSVDVCNKYPAADLCSSSTNIGRDQKETLSLVPSESLSHATVGRPMLKGNTKLPAGLSNVVVKQEPFETSHLFSSDVRTVNNTFLPSSQSQVASDIGAAAIGLFQGELLPGEASAPAKQKKNFCPRDSSIMMIDSLASTRNLSTADTSSALGNLHLHMVSDVVKQEPVETTDLFSSYVWNINNTFLPSNPNLERFSKIGRVMQRYRKNDKKRKLEQQLPNRPFFRYDLVAYHLADSEDRSLKDANTRNRIFQDDCGAQIKLVITEMLNEGKVETSVVYEEEEKDSISLPLSTYCPTTHFADIFAAQFQSLLVKEGYHIAGDRPDPSVHSCEGQSSSQHPDVIQTDAAPCGSVLQSAPTLIPGLSTSILTPMKSRMSALNTRQLSSQNILSRRQLLPHVNFQLPFQNLASNLSKPQIDIAAQVSPINPQWPEILNKHDYLQFQIMQSQRHQEQLMQKKALLGGLGAAIGVPGMMQWDGDISGIGDAVMALGGSVNSLQREQVPWIGNLGQFNNLGSNISCPNKRTKCFCMMSDYPSLLAKLALGEPVAHQGGAIMSRIPIQSNGMVKMQRPSIPNPACLMNNQQLPQIQIQQQLQMPYSQQQAGSFAEHVSSSLAQVNLQQLEQLLQTGILEWSANSAVQERNDGNGFRHDWF